MKIIIQEPAPVVTVEMESKQAPCGTCMYFQPTRDGDGVSTCRRANAGLSAKLIVECEQGSWYTKAVE